MRSRIMQNLMKKIELNFLYFIISLMLLSAFASLISFHISYPTAEFYSYQSYSNFFSTYGRFWRPLTLGAVPNIQYAIFGTNQIYYIFFSMFVQVYIGFIFYMIVKLINYEVNWLIALSVYFFLSSGLTFASAYYKQFTYTDIIFAAFYFSALLTALLYIKNNNAINIFLFVFFSLLMSLSKSIFVFALPIICLQVFLYYLMYFPKPASLSQIFIVNRKINHLTLLLLVSFFMAVIYVVFNWMLIPSSVISQSIAGTADNGNFKIGGVGNFVDNIGRLLSWALHLPILTDRKSVINYISGYSSFVIGLYFLYGLVFIILAIVAFINSKARRDSMLFVVGFISWMLVLSLPGRVTPSHAVIPSLFLFFIAANGLKYIQLANKKIYIYICLLLIIFSFPVYKHSSDIVYSEHRMNSFNGALNRIDLELRNILSIYSARHAYVDLCINNIFPNGKVAGDMGFLLKTINMRYFQEYDYFTIYKKNPVSHFTSVKFNNDLKSRSTIYLNISPVWSIKSDYVLSVTELPSADPLCEDI
jgi:hypothetical protein